MRASPQFPTNPATILCLIVAAVLGCGDEETTPTATTPIATENEASTDKQLESSTMAVVSDANAPSMGDLSFDDASEPTENSTSKPSPQVTSSASEDSPPALKIPQQVLDAPVQLRKQLFADKSPHRVFQAKTFESGGVMYHGNFLEYRPDGSVFKKGKHEYGQQTGPWEFFNAAGKVIKRGSYVRGQPEGEWRLYRDDGTLKWIERYRHGSADGTWIAYRKDGKTLLWERHYKDGERDGRWVDFREDGTTVSVEISYQGGERHGPTKTWHENGQLRVEGSFAAGDRHGVFTSYDPNGNVLDAVEWEHGKQKQR